MRTVALGELCQIVVGRTPARAEPEYWGRGHPWLSIADMNQGLDIRRTKEQITPLGAARGRRIDPGTVLLSFKLSIGKVAIAEIPLYTNEAIAALLVKDASHLNSRYLLRALQAMDLSAGSNRAAMGATLNQRSLASIEVPLPSLPQQRRIAAILDQADALRAMRRQILIPLHGLSRSLASKLTDDDRFPTVRLDSLIPSGERINYGVVQPGEEVETGVPLIRVANLVNGSVARPTEIKRISAAVEAQYQRSRLRGNEILVSCVGTIGAVSVVGPEQVGMNIARAISRVPIEDPVMRTYVAAALRGVEAQRYFTSELRTVAQPTLNVAQLAATAIRLPPSEKRNEFAAESRCVEHVHTVAGAFIRRTDELLASLQSRAFCGKL